MKNEYLERVRVGTEAVERDLRSGGMGSDSRKAEGGSVAATRITGVWPFKTVIVPPNAYVVHTRRGKAEPLHCGLGISFRFNPFKDAFFVAPAAIQTIIVNANCVSAERQGVMVQAYVQWMIDDFTKAYQRLDLSNQNDPMKVTNVQLSQQAEATLKDTVATMSIDAILSDKQPIIEELTRRLRAVAEGEEGRSGLGLRIVTVQIKEAVVSSSSLWETLQRGFRAERSKEARLAELQAQAVVKEREDAEKLKSQQVIIERDETIRKLKGEAESKAFDDEQNEKARRAALEAEQAVELATHQREALEQAEAFEQLKQQLTLQRRAADFEREMEESNQRLELRRTEEELHNMLSEPRLRAQLIQALPEVAQQLPKPESLRIYGGEGGVNQLSHLVTSIGEALESLGGSQAASVASDETLFE